jgi:hypothetical protein
MGVLGVDEDELGDLKAPGVAGGAMEVLARLGGDGVFAGDDMFGDLRVQVQVAYIPSIPRCRLVSGLHCTRARCCGEAKMEER